MPRFHCLLLLCLALAVTACEPAQGRLGGDDDDDDDDGTFGIDDSEIVDGEVLADYSGRLFVLNYGGNVAWSLASGSLPAGLSLDGDGTIHGVPTFLGDYSFEVLVSEMTIEDVTGTVELSIVAGAADLRPGFTRDQTTVLTEQNGLMTDPWLRLADAGIEEMHSYTLDLGLYGPGPDGVHEGGWDDDVRVGDLEPADVTIEIIEWDPVQGQALDDTEPSYVGDATFEAGTDTGDATVLIVHEQHGELETRLFVTAPDWCPKGEHDGGGWNDGFCL